MAASHGALPSELSAMLVKIAEICPRIENWALQPSPPDSPLIDLVKDRVRQLVAAVQYFSTTITHLNAELCDASTYTHALRLVTELLSEASSLLDLCADPNTLLYGDDGAINAVYASMFLVGGPHRVESGETVSDRVKWLRIADEFTQLIPPWCGPSATSRNYRWGLPSAAPPPPPSVFAAELGPEIASFVDRYIDAFRPRYIHSYSASNASPYIVDKSSVPASGSFGTVRKVFHKTTGESFAAKSFHNILSHRDRSKILREVGCLELCEHRNLITLVEAFKCHDDPHTITIVMAPWAPSTLWNFLLTTDARRKIEFPWFEPNVVSSGRCIYHIMLDIVDAIAFLHERSIKHKDIKPQNILLYIEDTGTIRPIVTDVGETKVYRAGAPTDPRRSSYEYLAPEQLLETEDMQSSLKADIWQLGCCFAMLLAVTRSGLSGLEKLWNSFTNTIENCSCNIANESVQFMATLHDIYSPRCIPQEHTHWVVTRMLDKNPITRFDIQDVRVELANLNERDSQIV